MAAGDRLSRREKIWYIGFCDLNLSDPIVGPPVKYPLSRFAEGQQ